ncbi:hypothetical protein BDP27DRAFT_246135 [Rhodocollybia butyracea]|uniref:Uncharacterized protein n=1 Tax=Rhodocollybia butyracea TaxID=206335 RepID=A0A9P5UBF0_9AGAR|nr:hypothetical protein BDP27DRAFT_246135 [Rhodocollybia butyracea]
MSFYVYLLSGFDVWEQKLPCVLLLSQITKCARYRLFQRTSVERMDLWPILRTPFRHNLVNNCKLTCACNISLVDRRTLQLDTQHNRKAHVSPFRHKAYGNVNCREQVIYYACRQASSRLHRQGEAAKNKAEAKYAGMFIAQGMERQAYVERETITFPFPPDVR